MKCLKQLDFLEARDDAMTQVAEHAEQHRPSFAEDARAFVLSFLANGEASSEEITNACKSAGIVPHDDRAFGPVYMSLSRGGAIQKCGACQRTKGHGTSGGIVWGLTK